MFKTIFNVLIYAVARLKIEENWQTYIDKSTIFKLSETINLRFLQNLSISTSSVFENRYTIWPHPNKSVSNIFSLIVFVYVKWFYNARLSRTVYIYNVYIYIVTD